jgi:4'-phosphopantetheinyl transferase EntD
VVVSMRSDQGLMSRVDEIALTKLPSVRGAVLAEVSIGSIAVFSDVSMAEVHASEVEFANSRPGRRRVEFLAGRRVLRAALREVGWQGSEALLTGSQGRPQLPQGFTASLTHKDGLAFAVAARADSRRTLGIDCEVVGARERSSIARKVLRPSELLRWQSMGKKWPDLLELFSTKEAIYKALHPHVPRYIGFEEAEIDEEGRIHLYLSGKEGPFRLSRHLMWNEDRLVVVVEAEPGL